MWLIELVMYLIFGVIFGVELEFYIWFLLDLI